MADDLRILGLLDDPEPLYAGDKVAFDVELNRWPTEREYATLAAAPVDLRVDWTAPPPVENETPHLQVLSAPRHGLSTAITLIQGAVDRARRDAQMYSVVHGTQQDEVAEIAEELRRLLAED